MDISQERPRDERTFLFRLCTQAHPWGYAADVQANQDPRKIPAEEMRAALTVYRVLLGNVSNEARKPLEAHKVPPDVAFPWDAKAPVPLALILRAIREARGSSDYVRVVCATLREAVAKLPAWSLLAGGAEAGNGGAEVSEGPAERIRSKALAEAREKFGRVKAVLEDPNGDEAAVFQQLVHGLRGALEGTEIPAPVFAIDQLRQEGEKQSDERDPAFNLFDRINRAGTAPTAEEIKYSLLKSHWREAAKTMDNLLQKRQLTHPARLVSLLSRLILTERDKRAGTNGFRDKLSIAQFRAEIGKNLHGELSAFCSERGWGEAPEPESPDTKRAPVQAASILEDAWHLLTSPEDDWTLPAVLAADITRHQEDLMLLILYWVYRLKLQGRGIADLSEEQKRRTLGFITAIHWFATDPTRCVQVAAKKLIALENGEGDIAEFFGRGTFRLFTTKPDSGGSATMTDLPDVATLKENLLAPRKDADSWDALLAIGGEPKYANFEYLYSEGAGGIPKFLKVLFADRRLVLFAQRRHMKDWFGWFDPTRVGQVTDHNAPWDFDHILPKSWTGESRTSPSIPNLVRIWISSNGNVRAWPAELNRSKGNACMIEKERIPEYGLENEDATFRASFVARDDGWGDLAVVQEIPQFRDTKHYNHFVEAAVTRTVKIYEEWHKQLRIDVICGGGHGSLGKDTTEMEYGARRP